MKPLTNTTCRGPNNRLPLWLGLWNVRRVSLTRRTDRLRKHFHTSHRFSKSLLQEFSSGVNLSCCSGILKCSHRCSTWAIQYPAVKCVGNPYGHNQNHRPTREFTVID